MAQEELQRQEREIHEEARHLQEQQVKHDDVMRRMREKSAQAAEQRRVEHAEERVQEDRSQGRPVGGKRHSHRGENARCWSLAHMTCKDHSRSECPLELYWETMVAGKSWKEGELWPGGKHHVGQVDRPTQETNRAAQEAGLAPQTATAVTDREARGDAGVYEVNEADCEMVCVVLEGGEALYQPPHWGSEGEGQVQAGPWHQVEAGQQGWFSTSTPHGVGCWLRLVAQDGGMSERAGCVIECSDGTTVKDLVIEVPVHLHQLLQVGLDAGLHPLLGFWL